MRPWNIVRTPLNPVRIVGSTVGQTVGQAAWQQGMGKGAAHGGATMSREFVDGGGRVLGSVAVWWEHRGKNDGRHGRGQSC